MLTYEDFCKSVYENMRFYLPGDGEDYDIAMTQVNKVNTGKRDSLSIRMKDGIIAPCVYMDDLYQKYLREDMPYPEILKVTAKEVVRFQEEARKDPFFKQTVAINLMDYEKVRDLIFVSAIGAERNSKLLETIPHKQMGDICAVYRIHLSNSASERATVLITNQMMEAMGVSAEELHHQAVENSMNRYPAVCRPLNDVLTDMFGGGDQIFDTGDTMPLYMLSNNELMDGAATIFYPGVAEKLQKNLPEGFYIIPSSIQELLIVPKNQVDKHDLERMVREINATEVDPSEQLSDLVHEYDPRQKVLYAGEKPPVPQQEQALENREKSL